MTTQEIDTQPRTSRTGASWVALRHPVARRYKVVMYSALAPLLPAVLWVGRYAEDGSTWPNGVTYAIVAVALLSLPLVFIDEHWAEAGVAVARGVVAVALVGYAIILMHDANPPAWVPLALYGGLAVLMAGAIIGKVAAYRDLKRNPSSASTA